MRICVDSSSIQYIMRIMLSSMVSIRVFNDVECASIRFSRSKKAVILWK